MKTTVERLIGAARQRDPWLGRWLPLICAHAAGTPVLELGCGWGDDTAVLTAAGLAVTAVDLSDALLAQARQRVPGATFLQQDLCDPWPLDHAGVILASLSLHYFDWVQTQALIRRAAGVLGPDGLLVCRLNSSRDVCYGALGRLAGHRRIEPGLYHVHGSPKRFVSAADVDRLFAGWRVLHRRHRVSLRFGLPKALWELVLQPPPGL